MTTLSKSARIFLYYHLHKRQDEASKYLTNQVIEELSKFKLNDKKPQRLYRPFQLQHQYQLSKSMPSPNNYASTWYVDPLDAYAASSSITSTVVMSDKISNDDIICDTSMFKSESIPSEIIVKPGVFVKFVLFSTCL